MNKLYAQKVELLLRILPVISQEECFAIHGGTAINLFVKDLPRYSVDIDLTYIPLEDRATSINNINKRLIVISDKIKKVQKGIRVAHRPDTCKLLCPTCLHRAKRSETWNLKLKNNVL